MRHQHLSRPIIDPDVVSHESELEPSVIETQMKLPHSDREADTVVSGSGRELHRSKPKHNPRAIAHSNWPARAASRYDHPTTSHSRSRRSNTLATKAVPQPQAKHSEAPRQQQSAFAKQTATKPELGSDESAESDSTPSESGSESDLDKSRSVLNESHDSVDSGTDNELQPDKVMQSNSSADSADENSELRESSSSASDASSQEEDVDEDDTSTESDDSVPSPDQKERGAHWCMMLIEAATIHTAMLKMLSRFPDNDVAEQSKVQKKLELSICAFHQRPAKQSDAI